MVAAARDCGISLSQRGGEPVSFLSIRGLTFAYGEIWQYPYACRKDIPNGDLCMTRERDEQITVGYCRDNKLSARLAKFFVDNIDTSYISHSEIQYGRAADKNHWSPRLKKLVKSEFAGLAAEQESTKESRHLIFAISQNLVVGVAIIAYNFSIEIPFAVLEDMVIDRGTRGQGIGSVMLAWLENEARKKRMHSIFLESGINNIDAHTFFKKNSFSVVSQVMMKPL
jgi:GNAT superfamily N-acetyltransferase